MWSLPGGSTPRWIRAPTRAAHRHRDAEGPECRRSGPSTAQPTESRRRRLRSDARDRAANQTHAGRAANQTHAGRAANQTHAGRAANQTEAASLSWLSVLVASVYSLTQRSITAEVFSTLVN